MQNNENTAFYTHQDTPTDQSGGDIMQQPFTTDAGHPPESHEAAPDLPESTGGTNKRGARRSRRAPTVVTPLVVEKIAHRAMKLPQKMDGASRKKQTAGDIVDMLIEPIRTMHERGYNVADIHRFLDQNSIRVSPAAVRAGMTKAGIITPIKRAAKNNKGGAQ